MTVQGGHPVCHPERQPRTSQNSKRESRRESPRHDRDDNAVFRPIVVCNSQTEIVMHENTEFTTTRDFEAIQIPSGNKTTIPAGTTGVITQTLGGSYTIATYQGLSRVAESDLDALGLDKRAASNGAVKSSNGETEVVDEKAVWDQLRQCFDPEIPVNIVDLGLVYDCRLIEKPEGGKKVEVKMTLTAPGCGMGPAIAHDAQSKILTIDGIDEADVQLVWDPPWNQSMISEAGRMKLGMV